MLNRNKTFSLRVPVSKTITICRRNNSGLLSYSAGNHRGSCLVKLHSGFHFKGHRLKVRGHGAAVTRRGHPLRV